MGDKDSASIRANATFACVELQLENMPLSEHRALVNKDVPDYALVYGVPAKIQGWIVEVDQWS